MKIGYLCGPVDARNVYKRFLECRHTDLFGTSYLTHLIEICEIDNIDAVIVTNHENEQYEERHGRFDILNIPKPKGKKIKYHVLQILWVINSLRKIEKRGASVVIMTAEQHYWFVTLWFRMRGMRFINSFHCAIRSLGHSKFSIHELFIRLTSYFHLSWGDPTMVIGPTIIDELIAEPGSKKRDIFQLVPDYSRDIFSDFSPPLISEGRQKKVNVIYAGRVTANKGVFDILTIAEQLAARAGPEVHFHIHGEGDAVDSLRAAAACSTVAHLIHIYGFTAGLELKRHYKSADIVIVPTRSNFEEGLAKSVVEGVLALRPVVTSRACPSIFLLSDACVEATVDQPTSYAEAIWQLVTEPEFAALKSANAAILREMFFDPPGRYDRRLKQALEVVLGKSTGRTAE